MVCYGWLTVGNLADERLFVPVIVAAAAVLGYLVGRLRATRIPARGQSLDAVYPAAEREIRLDRLTGLGNRSTLEESLANHFAILHRYELGFAVVVVDLDHFQRINEERGPVAGDQIIQRAARLLEDIVRETDITVRYGGEAFVVLLPNTDLDGASALAERWRSRIQRQLSLTVSGGVTAVLDGDTPETLLARAEAALCAAKSAGRNCVYRHDGEKVESILDSVAGGEAVGGP